MKLLYVAALLAIVSVPTTTFGDERNPFDVPDVSLISLIATHPRNMTGSTFVLQALVISTAKERSTRFS